MLKLQSKGVAIRVDEHHWTVNCVRSSEWSTFHLHLCISYQCIWGWQLLQKPSPKWNFTDICCYFYFGLGLQPCMILLTALALTDPQLPAKASNMCTTDASVGGVGNGVARIFVWGGGLPADRCHPVHFTWSPEDDQIRWGGVAADIFCR